MAYTILSILLAIGLFSIAGIGNKKPVTKTKKKTVKRNRDRQGRFSKEAPKKEIREIPIYRGSQVVGHISL